MFNIRRISPLGLMLLIFFLILSGNTAAADWVVWESKTTHQKDKTWTIKFNEDLKNSPDNINNSNIYVTGKNGRISNKVHLGNEINTILVEAPVGGYDVGQKYTLYIENILSAKGALLKKPVKMDFYITIEDLPNEDFPMGFELDGNIATVTTQEAFSFAITYPGVDVIQMTKGSSYTYSNVVSKAVVIPEGVNNEVFNFDRATITSLTVEGDSNTVQNATIESLTISDKVNNLELMNIIDSQHSSHTFDGGGGESIILSGDTNFKGEIRITSGEDIQVRTESTGARIEGTIWVDSGAFTKIAVPVSTIVVNSENDLWINSSIERLIARNDGVIQLGDNANISKLEKRIGVSVTITDENGNVREDMHFEEVLDTSELEWNLAIAAEYYQHAIVGDKNGNYSEEAKAILEAAIDKANNVFASNTSINLETQGKIDSASLELKSSITSFINSVVKVNRVVLHTTWKEAERFVKLIEVEYSPGQYSEELFNRLVVIIKAVKELYGKYEVSQAEINQKVADIISVMDALKASMNDSPPAKGTVSFRIIGEEITDNEGTVDFFRITPYSFDEYRPKYESKLIAGGIQFDLTQIVEVEETAYYAVIQTNGYLLIEELTLDELKEGVVRTVVLDDSYIPVNLSLPFKTVGYQDISLHVLGENEEALFGTHIPVGTYIPSGVYSVQCNGYSEESSYSLFRTNVILSKENSTILFTTDDIKLVDIVMEQKHPLNYKLKYVMPRPSEREKFAFTVGVNFQENVRSLYLSKEINNIEPIYSIDNGQGLWEIRYSTKNTSLLEDKEYKVSDSIELNATWRIKGEKPELNIDSELGLFLSVYLMNDLEQEVSIRKEDSYGMRYNVGGKIILKANGKAFEKDFLFPLDILDDITIKDIIGNEQLTGEALLEIHVEDSPIPIEPYVHLIEVVSN